MRPGPKNINGKMNTIRKGPEPINVYGKQNNKVIPIISSIIGPLFFNPIAGSHLDNIFFILQVRTMEEMINVTIIPSMVNAKKKLQYSLR